MEIEGFGTCGQVESITHHCKIDNNKIQAPIMPIQPQLGGRIMDLTQKTKVFYYVDMDGKQSPQLVNGWCAAQSPTLRKPCIGKSPNCTLQEFTISVRCIWPISCGKSGKPGKTSMLDVVWDLGAICIINSWKRYA